MEVGWPAEGDAARECRRPGGAAGGGEKKAVRRCLGGAEATSVSVAAVEGDGGGGGGAAGARAAEALFIFPTGHFCNGIVGSHLK